MSKHKDYIMSLAYQMKVASEMSDIPGTAEWEEKEEDTGKQKREEAMKKIIERAEKKKKEHCE